ELAGLRPLGPQLAGLVLGLVADLASLVLGLVGRLLTDLLGPVLGLVDGFLGLVAAARGQQREAGERGEDQRAEQDAGSHGPERYGKRRAPPSSKVRARMLDASRDQAGEGTAPTVGSAVPRQARSRMPSA